MKIFAMKQWLLLRFADGVGKPKKKNEQSGVLVKAFFKLLMSVLQINTLTDTDTGFHFLLAHKLEPLAL